MRALLMVLVQVHYRSERGSLALEHLLFFAAAAAAAAIAVPEFLGSLGSYVNNFSE